MATVRAAEQAARASIDAPRRLNLRAILRLALLEVKLLTKSRGTLIWFALVPLLFTAVFSTTYPQQPRARVQLSLTLADQASDPVSAALARVLEQEERLALEMLEGVPPDSLNPLRTLYLPPAFADSLYAGTPVKLALEIEESADAAANAAAMAALTKSMARFLGGLIQADAAGAGIPAAEAPESSWLAFGGAFDAALARPDRIQMRMRTPASWRPLPSGFAASAPAMLVMFLLLNVTAHAGAQLAADRQRNRLTRLATHALRPVELLAGRVAGAVAVGMVQMAILVGAGILLFHIDYGASLLGVVLIAASLASFAAGLGLLIGSWLRTDGQVTGATVLLVNVMAALSGCWWPTEVMPHWLQHVTLLLPSRWALDALLAMTAFGDGVGAAWPAAGVISGAALLALAVGARRVFQSE
jgi:ABC-type multidrug transport system permease subunit